MDWAVLMFGYGLLVLGTLCSQAEDALEEGSGTLMDFSLLEEDFWDYEKRSRKERSLLPPPDYIYNASTQSDTTAAYNAFPINTTSSLNTASMQIKPCYFPFTFNGVLYEECTMDGGTSLYWCSQTPIFEQGLSWSVCTGPGTTVFASCQSAALNNNTPETCIINPNDAQSMEMAARFCYFTESYYYEYSMIYCNGPSILEFSSTSLVATTVDSSNTAILQSSSPTELPSSSSTVLPTSSQTTVPLLSTTVLPTSNPTTVPLLSTTVLPTSNPTTVPPLSTTVLPTSNPTTVPPLSTTVLPTSNPTTVPLLSTTVLPPSSPTTVPLLSTTVLPTSSLTTVPLLSTTELTTSSPTTVPLLSTTVLPTSNPTTVPPLSTTVLPTSSLTTVPPLTLLTTSVPTSTPPGTTKFATLTMSELLSPDTTETSQPGTTESTMSDTMSTAASSNQLVTTTYASTEGTSYVQQSTSIGNVVSSSNILTTLLVSSGSNSIATQSSTLISAAPPSSSLTPPTSTSTAASLTGVEKLQLLLEVAFMDVTGTREEDVIDVLWEYSTSVTSVGFQQFEVPLVLYALGNITNDAFQENFKFSVDNVQKVLFVANQLLGVIPLSSASFGNKGPGSQLLECLENLFASMKTTNQAFNVSYDYVDLHCYVTSCSDLRNDNSIALGSDASISLPTSETNKDFPPGCYINVLSMSYRPQNNSFPNEYDNGGETKRSYYLASNILTSVIILNDQAYHTASISMAIKCTSGECDQTSICVFWDFQLNKWSSQGCKTQVTNGVTNCFCSHLTSFSVLMSDYVPDTDNRVLDYITTVGLVLSITALVICIFIQAVLLRHTSNLMASYRHIAILNMSIFLLLSYVSFMASSYIDYELQGQLCLAFTFSTHLSLLGFFCWSLVQTTFLVCRLVFVFHHVTKREFLVLSVILGYISPLIIAIATFLFYTPSKTYMKSNACWLSSQSGAAMAFTIPAITIISMNFLALIVVIRKLLRPSISEGSSEDHEVIKKLMKAVVFCTPQFGLTWAIGIPLLLDGGLIVLHYMFVLLNPLQGFFILIFGCLLDKKVMDLLKRHFFKTSPGGSTATTLSTY